MTRRVTVSDGSDILQYDKNFKNEFCICGRVYDPHTETCAACARDFPPSCRR